MNKKESLSFSQSGSSMLEVLLVMSIVAVLSPFLYGQISKTAQDIRDISTAQNIIVVRDSVLNFIRLNQDNWPDVAQIKMDPEDLKKISTAPHSGFIDKYTVRGAIVTDVYLAFDLKYDAVHTANIAKQIGIDAAMVSPDGAAYAQNWSVSAPDFKVGDLIYRIKYDFDGEDSSKYLHRASTGDDDLNVMQRLLDMGKFDIYKIGTVAAESIKINSVIATFIDTKNIVSSTAYFSSGANIDGGNIKIGSMRVNGDMTGFRNISAKKLGNSGFSTNGTIVTDRASIKKSINVAKDLTIKSDSTKTLSGFTAIIAHSLFTSFVYSDDIYFNNNFGLTVSGELLMSTVSPIKIGSWSFPSTTPPDFSEFKLSRANVPAMPKDSDFNKLMQSGWKE